MALQLLLSFALFNLLWGLVPGPSVVFTISYSMLHGTRSTVATILGQLAATLLQATMVTLGLGVLVAESELALLLIRAVGVAYLAILGIAQWRKARRASTETETWDSEAGGLLRRASRGFFVCATNPKAYLNFAAVLPQFVRPGYSPWAQFAALSAICIAVAAVVLLFYATLTGRLRRLLLSRLSVSLVGRLSGGMTLAAAAYVAFGAVSG